MASHPDTGPRLPRLTRWLMLSSVLLLQAVLTVSHAQITLDGSLGPRGPLTGPNYHIGADVGQSAAATSFTALARSTCPPGAARPSPAPRRLPIF